MRLDRHAAAILVTAGLAVAGLAFTVRAAGVGQLPAAARSYDLPLALLNEAVSIDAARAFALTIVTDGGTTDAERVTYAFRRALSRPPTAAERAILIRLIEKQKTRVAEGWINTHALSTGTDTLPALPAGVTPARLAGYTVAARALLSLDETITKQ